MLQESRTDTHNQPKRLYLSAGVSFFVAGINDGSLGSLIPM